MTSVKPTRPSELRQLLDSLGFHPRRALGQNFLIDGNIRNIILDAAAVSDKDSVLEVGAGPGVITVPLVDSARSVVAVEKDPRLAGYLQSLLRDRANFRLIEEDVLRIDLNGLLAEASWIVVANLPYSIAGRLLVDLAGSAHRPRRMLVMVQLEVADRLRAQPGSKAYGVLSVLVGLRYKLNVVRKISPTCFWPRPAVWSAVVSMEAIESDVTPDAPDLFRKLVRYAFSQRRKQLGGILAGNGNPLRVSGEDVSRTLEALDLESSRRPETLAPVTWCRLANKLGEAANPRNG